MKGGGGSCCRKKEYMNECLEIVGGHCVQSQQERERSRGEIKKGKNLGHNFKILIFDEKKQKGNHWEKMKKLNKKIRK